MSRFTVDDVAFDYGIFEDGELRIIVHSRKIAVAVVRLLNEDDNRFRLLNESLILL